MWKFQDAVQNYIRDTGIDVDTILAHQTAWFDMGKHLDAVNNFNYKLVLNPKQVARDMKDAGIKKAYLLESSMFMSQLGVPSDSWIPAGVRKFTRALLRL